MGQRSASTQSGHASGISLHGYQDHPGEETPTLFIFSPGFISLCADKKNYIRLIIELFFFFACVGPDGAPKSLLLKPGQSGLRPPGFSSLPARLTAFGFARSSSVSSVSSNQSSDSDRGQHSQGESPAVSVLKEKRKQPEAVLRTIVVDIAERHLTARELNAKTSEL